jgi:hypothetical protein
MKKTLTVVTLLAGAVAGYSQGAINFNIYTANFKQAVYGMQSGPVAVNYNGYTVNETIGSSSLLHESPTGSTVYTSAPLGAGFSAELLIGPAGASLGALLPFGGGNNNGVVSAFHTGAANTGFVASTAGVTLDSTSASAGAYAVGNTVSVALAAWNNEGGTVTSLAQAQAADAATPNSDPWGISNVVQSGALTAPPTAPVSLLGSGLESFSLGVVGPEPSTIALGVMGASAFLFRRRK